jgi:release factor glutamine methyltransferase
VTTVAALLARGASCIEASSDSPRLDASLLLGSVLQRSPAWLVAHCEVTPSSREAAAFLALCERRRFGKPLAYLLGSAGFYGREFLVDERVLVPRPETEHLVEEAVLFIRERMQQEPSRSCSVLDVGTGSGAIACTLALETHVKVHAVDVSPAAIELARENAYRLGAGACCTFWVSDLTASVRERQFDVVVANLPYVPTQQLARLPNPVACEPRSALDGGHDGLALYRRLCGELPALLAPDGLALFEAAPPMMPALIEIVRSALPEKAVASGFDYAGLARYVIARGPRFGGATGSAQGLRAV